VERFIANRSWQCQQEKQINFIEANLSLEIIPFIGVIRCSLESFPVVLKGNSAGTKHLFGLSLNL